MANTKYKYAAQLEAIHNQWCRDNGYPVVERPTFTSAKLQALQATSHKRDATSGCIVSKSTYKPQVTSNKLSHKLQAKRQAER